MSKPFDPLGNKNDLSTFAGRTAHFFDMIDPTLLLVDDNTLANSQKLMVEATHGTLDYSQHTDDELWRAKQIVEGTVHPQTGEKVLLPFRMAAFVPVNIPIAAGMLLSTSTAGSVFWQWFNQSFNAGFNYANRSGADEGDMGQLTQAYLMACGISMGVVFGFRGAVNYANRTAPALGNVLSKVAPYTAVAAAGVGNALLMRQSELIDGIGITDEDGNELGKSKAAGKVALTQVALSRIILPIPILLMPPIILGALNKLPFVANNPKTKLPLELAVITACLAVAFPPAIGLFPQRASLDVSEVEPRFQNLKDGKGAIITRVYFNKGV